MMDIKTGPKLFSFDSKARWINHASKIWRRHCVTAAETILVDQKGRIVTIGKDFMTAERDDAYPIDVYLAREDMLPAIQSRLDAATRRQEGGE